MTKLEEALASIPARRRGPICTLGGLLRTLPAEEFAALTKLIEDDGATRTPSASLSIAIETAYGFNVHRQTIDRHRRGECACGRTSK
jgi:hypothetical protein